MEITSKNGLRNLGNTCFMNAALQLLIHCRDLSRMISVFKTSKNLIGSYRELVCTYHDREKSVLNPGRVKHDVGRRFPRYRGYAQQDSHEFIIQFLDLLEEEVKKVFPKYGKLVSKLFDCQMKTTIVSDRGEKTEKIDPVRFLSVPVRPTLTKCFDSFVETDRVDDWEAPSGRRSRATKTTEIVKYPRNLVFQLKRFLVNRRTSRKITASVEIPLEWSPDGRNRYRLKGFVNQHGGLSGGHYTSFSEVNGNWYHFDDSSVSRASESRALETAKTAYLIYYVKL